MLTYLSSDIALLILSNLVQLGEHWAALSLELALDVRSGSLQLLVCDAPVSETA